MRKLRILWKLMGIAIVLIQTSFVVAEGSLPWTQPEVLRAAVEIGMREDQRSQFREAVSTYLKDLGEMVSKELGRPNAANIKRKIKSRNKKLVKAMDERMALFLSAEQIPRYEVYRERLLEALKP